jgi:hypothetical protein
LRLSGCTFIVSVVLYRQTACRFWNRPVEAAIYKSNLEGEIMNTYVILRRGAWASSAELGEAAERSTAVGEQMPDDVRWIRSYVLDEQDGRVGTVCIYQASSPEAIRDHAARAELAVDEIIPVADTVIVRPDPVAAPAS